MSQSIPIIFGDSFLDHHAGQIIQDPKYAIIELIANCWDAGATKVKIFYPEKVGERLIIKDNGTGMTREEFKLRWGSLNYNRLKNQGKNVVFPKGKGNRRRLPFGKNGIGRHAMFCFSNEYQVETSKNGSLTTAVVKKLNDLNPFNATIIKGKPSKTHGTTISGIAIKNIELRTQSIIDLIGSKFIADPEFEILVNNIQVVMTDLNKACIIHTLDVPDIGSFQIRRFEGDINRTTQQQGVAWWVHNRLVGLPSWDGVNGRLIDGRNAIAKKYVYVIDADVLKSFVKPDWSSFVSSPEVNTARQEIYDYINEDLISLLAESRNERRQEAFSLNANILKSLPKIVREDLSEVVDQLQIDCPTFGMSELETTVKILALMEKSRSGYSLLEKLSKWDSGNIDTFNAILEEWSITDVRRVQKELSWRLDLINELENLVDEKTTRELHDLQPLFERGLWIFGPEFESLSFTSNITLSQIICKFFGGAVIENRKRPDFVVLPNSTIGTYTTDSYDIHHEVDGIDSIIIIELKKGGFQIGYPEKDQAMGYARIIRSSGKVKRTTKITCYVLGSTIDHNAETTNEEGETTVIPITYNSVVKRAKARTFKLLSTLEKYTSGYNKEKVGENVPELFATGR